MSKHTPGPWHFIRGVRGELPAVREVKRPHGEASHYRADLVCAPESGFNRHICALDFGYGSKADDANARLIAAAPDLLMACKKALTLIESVSIHQEYHGDYAAVRAILTVAIRKTEDGA